VGWLSRLGVGVGLVALVTAGPARPDGPGDDGVKGELKRLEGTWRAVAAEMGGKKMDRDPRQTDLAVFRGDRNTLIVRSPGWEVKFENTFAIDPTKDPKWIDVTRITDKQSWRGIYELKGDTLRMVFTAAPGGARPAAFKTREGSQEVLFTYQRVRPEPGADAGGEKPSE
jgi:uncharacterized protein (TIGR03067 family)